MPCPGWLCQTAAGGNPVAATRLYPPTAGGAWQSVADPCNHLSEMMAQVGAKAWGELLARASQAGIIT